MTFDDLFVLSMTALILAITYRGMREREQWMKAAKLREELIARAKVSP